MDKSYSIDIKGMKRDLPLCKVTDDLYIGAFVIFGDVEITVHSAKELVKIAPEHDIMITAEAKSIPLIHEMARQNGSNTYLIARKVPKLYMKEVFSTEVQSITTKGKQVLHVDSEDVLRMKGKRVLIIDDVISTGESIRALEQLVTEAGGEVAGKMAILAEGVANQRDDIISLAYLPVFNADGTEK